MKLQITLKPNAKQEKVEKISATEFRVAVKAPPLEGKANLALVKLLAKYFQVPQSSIRIISGLKSKRKLVEVQP